MKAAPENDASLPRGFAPEEVLWDEGALGRTLAAKANVVVGLREKSRYLAF